MARPNVIVFFTDQQRWDTMGAHGNPLDLTPNLDRVAGRSTFLRNAFTCQPVCGPARSCMQTGRYATQTTCFRNGVTLPGSETTLAHCFRDAGYATGYIGKWHLASPEHVGPVPEELRGGYESWLGANALEFCSDAYDCVLYDEANEPVHLPGYRVDAMTDAAIRFAAAERDRPFFLFFSLLEPHHQNFADDYPAPDGLQGRYHDGWTPPDLKALGGSSAAHLAGYYGMVKRIDEAYGRLMDALKSRGMLENTIVLFTSDHGCHFKTRNEEYKRSCHESSLRLPAVLSGPGFDHGRAVGELVSLVDFPPTLLDAAGLPVPERMAGRSVRPLVGAPGTPGRESVFAQISEAETGRAVRTERWKYSVRAPEHEVSKSRSDAYREAFLYDLERDPCELDNLAGLASHRGVADRLKGILLRWIEEVEGERPAILDAEERPAGLRRVNLRDDGPGSP